MSATIPQPYQYFSTGEIPPSNLFDDMVPLVSSSSHNTSFLPSSTLGRMSNTSPPMNQVITEQYQPPPLPPSVDHSGSNNVLFSGAVHVQQPTFPHDLAGVGFPGQAHQQHHQQHPHHPPPPPPPPPAAHHPGLHAQHPQADINQPPLLHGPQRSSLDLGSHNGQLPPQFDRRSSYPATLPTTERSDQLPSQAPNPLPQPKKRGRKPKNHNSGGSASSTSPSSQQQIDDDLDGDGLPKDPRRRRILERNRIAATKCRLRKRDEASALASREQQMEDQNRYLASTFDSLTTEIYQLKTQLLRHTECNCVLIQRYIANEARKSVDVLAPGSSPPFAYLQHHHHHHHQQHLPQPTATAVMPAVASGSASPYSYSRLGSSTGSSSDSTSLQSPEGDAATGAIQWTNPFIQAPGPAAAATSNPQVPPPPPPLPQQHMESSPDPLCAVHSVPMTPVNIPPGYGEGLYIGMGPQSEQVNKIGWDVQWNFPQQ